MAKWERASLIALSVFTHVNLPRCPSTGWNGVTPPENLNRGTVAQATDMVLGLVMSICFPFFSRTFLFCVKHVWEKILTSVWWVSVPVSTLWIKSFACSLYKLPHWCKSVHILLYRPKRSMGKNARWVFTSNCIVHYTIKNEHGTYFFSKHLNIFQCLPVRSALDPLPCSDGARAHGCVSRRQKSVRPAAKWKMFVRHVFWTWSMVSLQLSHPLCGLSAHFMGKWLKTGL